MTLSLQLMQLSSTELKGCAHAEGGFPSGFSGKDSDYQCRCHRRCDFNPWDGKILEKGMTASQYSCLENPWAGGYNPWGCKRVRHGWARRHIHAEQMRQGLWACVSVRLMRSPPLLLPARKLPAVLWGMVFRWEGGASAELHVEALSSLPLLVLFCLCWPGLLG